MKTLLGLCIKVAKEMVSLKGEIDRKVNPKHLTSNLIFPKYKHQKEDINRISEQESRVLFCKHLQQCYHNIFFSVETPTERKYTFGKKLAKIIINDAGRSASSDITLYELKKNNFAQQINIELKAHNVAHYNIAKDFLKLISEPYSGLFFHTLESADNGTLTSDGKQKGVLIKYREASQGLKKQIRDLHLKDDGLFILFCICCLHPYFILTKKVFKYNIQKSFSSIGFQYEIKGNDIDVLVNDGWQLCKP